MGRPTNRHALRRDASLAQMAGDVALPLRLADESHGAYYRRCALLWLASPGERDPRERAEVVRLSLLASKPAAPGLSAED